MDSYKTAILNWWGWCDGQCRLRTESDGETPLYQRLGLGGIYIKAVAYIGRKLRGLSRLGVV